MIDTERWAKSLVDEMASQLEYEPATQTTVRPAVVLIDDGTDAVYDRNRPKGANSMRPNPEIHSLACFVHGVLCAFHALGVLYNVKRKNRTDAVIHTACILYDARAVHHHYREVRNVQSRLRPTTEATRLRNWRIQESRILKRSA